MVAPFTRLPRSTSVVLCHIRFANSSEPGSSALEKRPDGGAWIPGDLLSQSSSFKSSIPKTGQRPTRTREGVRWRHLQPSAQTSIRCCRIHTASMGRAATNAARGCVGKGSPTWVSSTLACSTCTQGSSPTNPSGQRNVASAPSCSTLHFASVGIFTDLAG